MTDEQKNWYGKTPIPSGEGMTIEPLIPRVSINLGDICNNGGDCPCNQCRWLKVFEKMYFECPCVIQDKREYLDNPKKHG